jgi:hypothetical protein
LRCSINTGDKQKVNFAKHSLTDSKQDTDGIIRAGGKSRQKQLNRGVVWVAMRATENKKKHGGGELL